jgi:exodeoxyribonuclease VII large subunit
MEIIQHIKLSELTKEVENVIKNSIGSKYYWIIAEISGHKFYPNQDRHYFDFIEKVEGSENLLAKVSGKSWTEGSRTIKIFENETGQKFSNGLQVLVKVKVEYHSLYGFSLILHDIDQSFTLGNIEKQRRETLTRLVAENIGYVEKIGEEYITKNKKIQFNAVLQNIAIIGSPNSEGYTDFTHTINNNQFGYKFSIDIYQSSVQGTDAGNEMVKKLVAIYESKKAYDCVVIIRGGGAKTDFLAFDTYSLSRAVARFPVPVITGIGHHKDVSIVDLMVHTSTKTPTKAAEFIISHCREFEESVLTFQKAVIIKSQQMLSHAKQSINSQNIVIINKSRTFTADYKEKLNSLNQIVINKTKTILYNRQTNLVSLLNQILSKPKMISSNKISDLNNVVSNLKIFSNKYLINKKGYLGHYESVIKLMSPDNILKRGFAIVSQNGKILNNGATILKDSNITVSMVDYEINTKVITKTKKDGTESNI